MSNNNIGSEHFGFVLRPVAQGFDPSIAWEGTSGGCSICKLFEYDPISKIILLNIRKDLPIRVKEAWIAVQAGGKRTVYEVEQSALNELNARRPVSLIVPPTVGGVSAIRLAVWRVGGAEAEATKDKIEIATATETVI
jgi:hypothetical protein